MWRVDGILNGRRIRRNFDERSRAVNEADRLEIEAQQADAALCSRLTRLSSQQLHAAEILFDRAGGDLDKVLGLLSQIRAVERMAVKQAAIAWLSDMERSGKREVTVSVNRYMVDAFLRGIDPEAFCDEISQAAVEGFVFEPASRVSQRDRRQRLGQFMGSCQARGWLARNFAAELPKIKVERDLPAILSAGQIKTLLDKARSVRRDEAKVRKASAGGSMELYLLLAAFTGLRPAEVRKIGKAAFHLDADPACIEIGAKMAKVNQCRQIELLDAVRAKLETGNLKFEKSGRVFFDARLWKKVRKEAGLLPEVRGQGSGVRGQGSGVGVWRNDILRHTYASWHYAIFKDIRRLAYTMGNSPEVLFQNYIRPMTEAAALEYLTVFIF